MTTFPSTIAETGVTKRRRLYWLTNRALVYDPNAGKWGGGGGAGPQPMRTAVHIVPK
jgi:hypothetical protein